jgi:hypothetical protein
MRKVAISAVLIALVFLVFRAPVRSDGRVAPAQLTPTSTRYLPIVMNPTLSPTPPFTATPIRTPTEMPTLAGIKNGGFEQGHTSWVEIPTNAIITQAAPVVPNTGQWLAALGGENNSADEVRQIVTVPSGGAYLRYAMAVESGDVNGRDRFEVLVNATVVSIQFPSFHLNWHNGLIDLSAYAGQTVTLRFRNTTDASGISTVYLDDVTFVVVQ